MATADPLDNIVKYLDSYELPDGFENMQAEQAKWTEARDAIDRTLSTLQDAIVADIASKLPPGYEIKPTGTTTRQRKASASAPPLGPPYDADDQDKIVSFVAGYVPEDLAKDKAGTPAPAIAEHLGVDAKDTQLRDTLKHLVAEGRLGHNQINNRWSRYFPAK